MSTYVIGDLQGCFEEFQKLLTTVQFREDRGRFMVMWRYC